VALALDAIDLADLFVPWECLQQSVTLMTDENDIFVAQTVLSEIILTTLGFGHSAGSTSIAFISELTLSDGGVLDMGTGPSTFEWAFSTSATFALQTDGRSTARSWASLTSYKVV
jgi:hypothetical protein